MKGPNVSHLFPSAEGHSNTAGPPDHTWRNTDLPSSTRLLGELFKVVAVSTSCVSKLNMHALHLQNL